MSTDNDGTTRQPDRGASNAGVEGETRAQLQDLDRRLSQAARKHAAPADSGGRGSALGLAFRLAVELVAGLVVGGGMGWLLDKWLGTLPIMLLIFFVLGAAAGIFNVIRTAKQMQAQSDRAALDIDGKDGN